MGLSDKNIKQNLVIKFHDTDQTVIRPSQTAAVSTFAANRKEVLNLSNQEDLVPNYFI